MALIRIEPKKDSSSDLYYVEIFYPADAEQVRDDRATVQDGGGGRERRHRHHREPCQQSAVGKVRRIWRDGRAITPDFSSLRGANATKQSSSL